MGTPGQRAAWVDWGGAQGKSPTGRRLGPAPALVRPPAAAPRGWGAPAVAVEDVVRRISHDGGREVLRSRRKVAGAEGRVAGSLGSRGRLLVHRAAVAALEDERGERAGESDPGGEDTRACGRVYGACGAVQAPDWREPSAGDTG